MKKKAKKAAKSKKSGKARDLAMRKGGSVKGGLRSLPAREFPAP